MAFMEKELLSVKNPLYGRTTGFYKLEELSFSEAQVMGAILFNEVEFLLKQELTDAGSDYLFTNVIEPDLNRFLGPVFEKIAIQYLNRLKQQNHLPYYYLFSKSGFSKELKALA